MVGNYDNLDSSMQYYSQENEDYARKSSLIMSLNFLRLEMSIWLRASPLRYNSFLSTTFISSENKTSLIQPAVSYFFFLPPTSEVEVTELILSVSMCGFVEPTLCTTSTAQSPVGS